MMFAEARIEGYTVGYPEFLSVTYEHPDFSYNVSPCLNITLETCEALSCKMLGALASSILCTMSKQCSVVHQPSRTTTRMCICNCILLQGLA